MGIALRRKLLVAAAVIIAVSISSIAVAYYWTNQIDTSWIETVNNQLESYHSYVNETQAANSPITMAFIRMYYRFENGSSVLLYYGEGDTLSIYLTNLLGQANIQKGTLNLSQANEIQSSSRALILTYRAGSAPGIFNAVAFKYGAAYFILDNKNQNLKGTILAELSGTERFNVLALGKLH